MEYQRRSTRKHRVAYNPRLAKADTSLQDMQAWCNKMVGPQGTAWRYGWDATNNYFHFTKQQDALMFMLRWDGNGS